MSDTKYAIFNKNETVAQSLYKDFVTGVLVAFCVYISQDSTWWTFVTGLMFIVFLLAKVKGVMKDNHEFKNKEDLQKWVDDLPDV